MGRQGRETAGGDRRGNCVKGLEVNGRMGSWMIPGGQRGEGYSGTEGSGEQLELLHTIRDVASISALRVGNITA